MPSRQRSFVTSVSFETGTESGSNSTGSSETGSIKRAAALAAAAGGGLDSSASRLPADQRMPGAHEDWTARFGELTELEAADRAFVERQARLVELPEGQTIFSPGKKPDAFLLVLEGTVVVHQVGAGGREIVLYRVSGGESCIMTTACLLSDESYLAEGVTETPVSAIALGRADFDALVARSGAFRRFVFSKYASRVTRLMALLEDVAFERIDKRLAGKLIELADPDGALETTHHHLAVELGSAREVISRQVKEFTRRGWLSSGRGRIEILDREALAALAEGA